MTGAAVSSAGASGVGIGVVVAFLVLVALAPWWAGGRRVVGRAVRLAADAGVGAGAGAPAAVGVDAEVALALVGAACRSGVSVVRALDAVGAALAGEDGRGLRSAASRLALGASWDEAWASGGRPAGGAVAAVLREALRPTWEYGAPPEPALRAATDQLRRGRAERSATAAGRLGVRLVLPLGLCYLPAFVLVGLVPVLVSYGVGLLGRT